MADLLNKVAPFGIWVVPALAVAISMINGSFFHQIFNLVDSTLTSPIPENADENFWVLQSAFLGAICLATYAFLHSDKVEGYVLKEMFVNDAQRGLARALLLAPIKGVLFLFVSQQVWSSFSRFLEMLLFFHVKLSQVVMFVSSLTLPPGANSNSPWMIEEPSLLESARRFMDGKLIIMLYATMGLAILGVKTGLLSVRPRFGPVFLIDAPASFCVLVL